MLYVYKTHLSHTSSSKRLATMKQFWNMREDECLYLKELLDKLISKK